MRGLDGLEEMDAHTWRTPGDPALYRAIAFTWELARRTNPRRFTPGVYKYRDIEEMNRADDRRLREHLEARRDRPAGADSERIP